MTKSYESRLEELRKEVKRELRPVTQPVKRAVALVQRPSLPLAIVLGLGKFALVLALPFLVYVRSAVGLYSDGGLSPMLSVVGAGMITAALLALYASWLSRRFRGKARAESISLRYPRHSAGRTTPPRRRSTVRPLRRWRDWPRSTGRTSWFRSIERTARAG